MIERYKKIFRFPFRNSFRRNGTKVNKNSVNLEYFDGAINLGDQLAPIIYQWMLEQRQIKPNKKTNKTYHLMSVGSLIGGSGEFDSIVWGTGVRSLDSVCTMGVRKYFQKLDIRAVRGPITKEVLDKCGYDCPEIYGDPALLMPQIYDPRKEGNHTKKYKTSIILHFLSNEKLDDNVNVINIATDDYKYVIDEICCSEKIISSSLHGIILAEAYGVPAVFYAKSRGNELIKYYDWYYSTGRKNIIMADNLRDAIKMEPMELPELDKMREDIYGAFPYDLWE